MGVQKFLKMVYLFPFQILMGGVATNTYTTTLGVSNNREDLSNEIYLIAPVDTLFTSKIGQVPATNVKH